MDTIVYHTTTTTWAQAIATFQGGARLVSAHYVVDRDLDRIAQCVREGDTAWAAGNWPINQRSINIERADNGDFGAAGPQIQLDRIVALSLDIIGRNPITTLIRHDQATATACPDGMDTQQVFLRVRGGSMALTAEDKAYIDQRIRDIILGEPALTMTATKRWLVAHTELQAKPILDGVDLPTVRKGKPPTKVDVQKGHGRG